ncbi:MAG: hypothetical protein FWG70_05510 [Oscillospiraceae bacterium]|nr:hypothetical protein [Oscillospiraceae bacterium]
MEILRFEVKKLICSPAIWIFFVLCLGLNLFSIISDVNYENDKSLEPENVFADYDTSALAESYVNARGLNESRAEDMREKYAAMQIEVDKKAERGDALSPYFTDETYFNHGNLFNSVMTSLATQGILLTVIITLYILGFENLNRTEQVVYSAKFGRRITLLKFAAAVFGAVCMYLFLSGLTLAVFFTLNDFSGVFGDNVSSGFNYVREALGVKPFMTWRSFTVLSYLLAVICMTVGLILCFALACFAVGTAIRNSYIAFLTVFAAACALITTPMVLPANSLLSFGFILSPVWLWLKQSAWFTDGDFDVLWRDFETRGVAFSLVILSLLSIFAAVKFRKKEIV